MTQFPEMLPGSFTAQALNTLRDRIAIPLLCTKRKLGIHDRCSLARHLRDANLAPSSLTDISLTAHHQHLTSTPYYHHLYYIIDISGDTEAHILQIAGSPSDEASCLAKTFRET